jgi:hypothetical protein
MTATPSAWRGNRNKILVGIAATAIVIAVSMGFISLFPFPTFTGWVSYFLMSLIPMEIVASVTWGAQHPRFAGDRKQPVKGLLLILVCLVAAVVVATVQFVTIGGRVSPPAPMLIQCTILSVIVTFWLAIMWGGWPFTKIIKNPTQAGLALLVACYLLTDVLFHISFDYSFMKDAPVYVASLDPHGLFNAWNALVFCLAAITVMFLSLNFDLWPFTQSAALMRQPVLGIVWTAAALVLGGLCFYISVVRLDMDVVTFMVHVPVPFIFGTIIVLNMLQGSLFGELKQPLKGVLNTLASAAIGSVLALGYGIVAPVVTGRLKPGPPSYDFEIWLASSLLAVTFPFLIFHAEFFKFWPLQRTDR